MELTYKRATLKDVDALADERAEAWKAEHAEAAETEEGQVKMQSIREHAKSYYRRNLTDHGDVAFLAYDGSKIAGFGSVCFVHRRPVLKNQDKERAYISQLFTRPDYADCGVGYKILDLLVSAAMQNDVEEISAEPTCETEPVFKRYGFVQDEEEWKYA